MTLSYDKLLGGRDPIIFVIYIYFNMCVTWHVLLTHKYLYFDSSASINMKLLTALIGWLFCDLSDLRACVCVCSGIRHCYISSYNGTQRLAPLNESIEMNTHKFAWMHLIWVFVVEIGPQQTEGLSGIIINIWMTGCLQSNPLAIRTPWNALLFYRFLNIENQQRAKLHMQNNNCITIAVWVLKHQFIRLTWKSVSFMNSFN